MTLKLYDLALADVDLRPSPWCWLAKFALLHKEAEFETVPLRFAEKEKYPDPEHAKLPILVSGDEMICDSAAIAAWVEKTLPGEPLAASPGEWAAYDFFHAWLSETLYPAMAPLITPLVYAHVHEDDRDYYRESREERYGKSLEELAETPGARGKVEAALRMLAAPLARHRFFGGPKPNICDYLLFSPLMWKRVMAPGSVYEAPQAVEAWAERMLDLFDGYARKAKTVE